MKRFFLILTTLGFLGTAWAQDYHQRFSQALNEGDSTAQRTILNEWTTFQPTGAEYFIDWFNFYVNRSMTQSLLITSDPEELEGEVFAILDSMGNPIDYIGECVPTIDSTLADSALLWIDKGLAKHPYRLDMWMGKIHFLGMALRWDDFEHTLISLIGRYATTKTKLWAYPDIERFDKEMFSESVLEYQQTIVEEINFSAMERNDTLMLQHMAGIAQQMLKHYPKDIYQLNIMAVYYNALGQPQECLKYLLKAEKQDRRDCTVLSNIANAYHMLGNYKQERKYLEKVLKYGDEGDQEYARHFLKELDSIEK